MARTASVTIKNVAERAGVSTATVSYVLNGRETEMRISDDTRQRILDAVRELGYHPNALARSLAHRSTRTIAVVMQYPRLFAGWSGFTNELMHGVTDAAIESGYDVLLHTRAPNPDEPLSPAERIAREAAVLTDGRVDGALLLRDVDDPLADALCQRGLPAVRMFTHAADEGAWYVDCDNVEGGRLAAAHLLALGHRRIAHLMGPSGSGAARERRQGYAQALSAAGVAMLPAWSVEVTGPNDDFTHAARLFANTSPDQRPTALFAWSDDVAITMMRVLRGLGLRVPHEVSVVGFDSTALCDHTDPPLTSVRQPIYEMAAQALNLLVARLEDKPVPQTQFRRAPYLDVRGSCGPVCSP